jgi:hypothetical protein
MVAKHDEMSVPLSDFVRAIAREAGFAAGKELMESHTTNCDALKLVPEMKQAIEEITTVKRVRLRVHWALALVVGGILYGGGQWMLTKAVSSIENYESHDSREKGVHEKDAGTKLPSRRSS